jgi:tetratricopeptide (TPR) repeat protein
MKSVKPSDAEFQDQIRQMVEDGEIDRAVEECDAASAQVQGEEQSFCLSLKGDILLRSGRVNDAIHCFRRAAAILKEFSIEGGYVHGYVQYFLAVAVGLLDEGAGRVHAESALPSLLALLHEDVPVETRLSVQGMVAELWEIVGRYEEALAGYQLVFDLTDRRRDKIFAGKALAVMIGVVKGYEAGRRAFEDVAARAQEEPTIATNVLWEFGCFEWHYGHHDEALRCYLNALRHLKEDPLLTRDGFFQAHLYWRIARLYYAQQSWVEAASYADLSLRFAQKGDRFWGGSHLILAHVFAANGAQEPARRSYREALGVSDLPEEEREEALEGLSILDEN